ncbi:MAG: formate--tetrahydrofolate ligase [Atribacterota bacterium]|nr:formate--tetrahydrofolate ligase [Atribacterota bacterium]MDD4896001.1 formate--tetrahydrofolate ligase [Atribacterota bacterium]MDD5638060.1 formate--tetrahydrofolate ligase [Atribacterota bacterium]
MFSDLEIAQKTKLLHIIEIADSIGIKEEELELYGKYKAKVKANILERITDRPQAKYIVVTAITPTPLGEGKTVTSIGLGQGLAKLGKKVINTLREPSMGPVFGIKGGAAGGGYSQVVPMEDLNLHFTGDIHAVGAANNLLCAMLDTHLQKGNKMNIDIHSIGINRVVDISDRALRNIVIGLRGKENGIPRETGFDITVASEVMAILAMATNIFDLRERLSKMTVAYTKEGQPVTAEDLKAAGAMTVLLKDALNPNLIQTLEHGPCFMHCGPFANIAHGNNSVLADLIATKLADYVVTESGFGSDMGFEKMCNIKCRTSNLKVDCAVIVCTIRALKMHGGIIKVVAGKPLDMEKLAQENLPAVEKGCKNLEKHIENVLLHGINPVVVINSFPTDTREEIELIKEKGLKAGASAVVTHEGWAKGGAGCIELAEAVVEATEKENGFHHLYPLEATIKEKIEIIATKIYGAEGVTYLDQAEKNIKLFESVGFGNLPICMAKTHLSLSHDPSIKGRPRNYKIPIRDIRASVGAGFLYPLLGTMMTMPGLPSIPAATKVDIDKEGNTVGLF